MASKKLLDIISKCQQPEIKADFDFFKANVYKHTLLWEGGDKLHNVEGDTGGWTKYGVAFNKNKDLFDTLEDFKDTTYDEASALAFMNYFLAIHAPSVPKEAQLMYFDFAYNCGPGAAIKMMQRSLGLTDDGGIGPITKSKMNAVTKQGLYEQRKAYYNRLVEKNASQSKFLKGWMNRADDILKK